MGKALGIIGALALVGCVIWLFVYLVQCQVRRAWRVRQGVLLGATLTVALTMLITGLVLDAGPTAPPGTPGTTLAMGPDAPGSTGTPSPTADSAAAASDGSGAGLVPPPKPTTATPARTEGRVTGLVDGASLEVDGRRIGLIGIAPTDPRPACDLPGTAAELATLLPVGTPVRLAYDSRYGDALAFVHRTGDGLFVNRFLVRHGHAALEPLRPGAANLDLLEGDQAYARDNALGLWKACRVHTAVTTPAPTPRSKPKPPPAPAPKPTTTSPPAPHRSTVIPGAFCSSAGAIGYSAKGVRYVCRTDDAGRLRWRRPL